MQPNDQMSAAKVYLFSLRTSGAKIIQVPTYVLASLLKVFNFIDKPKLAIFISKLSVSNIFYSFRSLCITSLECMYHTPTQICQNAFTSS